MPDSPLTDGGASQTPRAAAASRASVKCTGDCLSAARAVFEEATSQAQARGCRNPDLAKRFQFLLDLADNDRHQEAEILFEHAVALYEAVYGQEHVTVAKMMHSLSQLYERHGNHDYAQYLASWADDILSAQRAEPTHEFFRLFGFDAGEDELGQDSTSPG